MVHRVQVTTYHLEVFPIIPGICQTVCFLFPFASDEDSRPTPLLNDAELMMFSSPMFTISVSLDLIVILAIMNMHFSFFKHH